MESAFLLGGNTGGSGGGGAVDSVNGQTGTVVLTKASIGLSNVNNTSDANKPVSTAQQVALDAKASIAQLNTHASATNNPHAVTKAQVGLGNVSNDLQLKAIDLDTDPLFTANSNSRIPAQAAVKAYVDAAVAAGGGGGSSLRPQHNLDGNTVLQKNQDNWDSISADSTYTISGSPANGDVTNLNLTVLVESTITFPAARRVGSSGLVVALLVPVGNHELSFKRVGGEFWLADSVGATTETPYTAPDLTAPTVGTPSINSAGDELSIPCSEAVTFGSGGTAGFVLSASGGPVTLTYASGGGSSTPKYTPSRTILSGETLSLAYTQPGSGVRDLNANDLVSFSGKAVTNGSSASAGGTSGWLYNYPTSETLGGSTPPSEPSFTYLQRITADKTTTVSKLSVFMQYVNYSAETVKMAILSADGSTVLAQGSRTGLSGADIDVDVTLGTPANVNAGVSYIIAFAFSGSSYGNFYQGTGGASNTQGVDYSNGYSAFPTVPQGSNLFGTGKVRVGIYQD